MRECWKKVRERSKLDDEENEPCWEVLAQVQEDRERREKSVKKRVEWEERRLVAIKDGEKILPGIASVAAVRTFSFSSSFTAANEEGSQWKALT